MACRECIDVSATLAALIAPPPAPPSPDTQAHALTQEANTKAKRLLSSYPQSVTAD